MTSLIPQARQRLHNLLAVALLLSLTLPARADFKIASGGKARCIIIREPNATAAESNAVCELATTLEKITGAKFQIEETGETNIPGPAIIVGPGAVAQALFPDVALDKLGPEEFVQQKKGGHLLLAGGRPRGTLYAVYRFLQDQCGVRWWTPWAATIPSRPKLSVTNLAVHGQPAFEYRGPYWFSGFDPLWKARNGANDESHVIPAALGGCIQYKGFCHTFYPLVPPEKYFAAHPEWYSLINGKRTHDRAQLCLSNPELRDFVVQRVKEWLREAPDAEIISVTQNDCDGACQCANCKAIDDAEGSPSGSMLSFVNYIAEKIEPEFPNVAVDTFAYQYTRPPPRTIRARPNVIVRLCSIECNFRAPLDHPSNAAFLADLAAWSKICARLYVWDYVTEFSSYVNPHPNWFVMGANARIFQQYGVKGVFEEGAYAGQGAEMAELRAWLLAQLLWNPRQDDRALIKEFLRGYYGVKPGDTIGRYLELMQDASAEVYLRCYVGDNPPYLRFAPLAAAEKLWEQAEDEAKREPDPEKLARVRIAHLPVQFACLSHWRELRRECWEQNATWPWPESRGTLAGQFREVCAGVAGKDWTQVRVLNEPGLQVEDFLKKVAQDVPDTNGPAPPKRLLRAPLPADLPGVSKNRCVDLQDNLASLYKPGKFAEIRPDVSASDQRAVWMPGDHREWAFRIPGTALPSRAQTGKWKVYAVVRAELEPDAAPDSIAFGAGVYDAKARSYPADFRARVGDVGPQYRSYLLGTVETSRDRDIWVAPAANKSVRAIYVDRIFLVPAS